MKVPKKKSEYKGVFWQKASGEYKWTVFYMEEGKRKSLGRFDDEKEAAKTYDRKLIALGKDPVNILKKVIK